jgi:hypothetical protein
MASILKVDTIQDQSGNNIINENADTITIGASGDTVTVPTGASLTVPNGGLSGQNYPAFEAYLSANQNLTDNVNTKIQFDTELFDTDSCYDNVTNYRFTPNVAGKYYVYFQTRLFSVNTAQIVFNITKNGSTYRNAFFDPINGQVAASSFPLNGIIDMNGTTDYLEFFVQFDVSSGTPVAQSGIQSCYFGAYRIGD